MPYAQFPIPKYGNKMAGMGAKVTSDSPKIVSPILKVFMISNAINNYERRCEAACRQTSPQKLWYLQVLS